MIHSKFNIRFIVVLFLALMVGGSSFSQSHRLKKVQDLSGKWKFSIGDDEKWAYKDFDDSGWENILVPRMWEKQGFYGYDGYAWYRTKIHFEYKQTNKPMYLSLGYIDDVDEVYINGILIGHSGSFPRNYATAFNAKRVYRIPFDILNLNGKNTIAVRVYDEGGEGGIIHGTIGILVDVEAIPVDLNLQGEWNFRTGDIRIDKEVNLDFSSWKKITVPGMWENQGYKDYDGIACYAFEFDLNDQFINERMVLVLGKIDDMDQVFLNGQLVGSSGNFKRSTIHREPYMHKQLRGYYLPNNALINKGKNVLVVKVMDAGGIGGLYEGSIGLITQPNYIDYWKLRKNSSN